MKSGTASTKSDTCATSGGMTRKPTAGHAREARAQKTMRGSHAAAHAATLERLDGGVERAREDDRDEDPA